MYAHTDTYVESFIFLNNDSCLLFCNVITIIYCFIKLLQLDKLIMVHSYKPIQNFLNSNF